MSEVISVLGPASAHPPPPRPGRRFEPLATTAWALMANTVTTSALGVVFWAVASRVYSPRELGEDAALISAMMLLSTVAQLNLSMGIPRLLPQVRHARWRPVVGAYALTAGIAALVTGAFLVIAPRLSPGFAFLGASRALGLALVAAVVLWNVFALQDAVLTSARWAVAIPVENAVFGVLKIALMVWLAQGFTAHGVFVGWLLAMALLLLPMNGLIFWRVLPARECRQEPDPDPDPVTVLPLGQRRNVVRYLFTDYVAALLSQGSTALLPLLVIGVLGQADNAYFYVAFLIATAVGALAHSLSTSLVAEGAHDESNLAWLARRSVIRYLKFVVPAAVVLIVAAPLALAPFGAAYASNGTTPLRLLLAGTVPQAVVTLYLGVERVRARVKRVLAVEAATLVLVTVGAVLGMRWYGLTGIGLAWLGAQLGVAALVAPRLWRVVGRAHSSSEGHAEVRHSRVTGYLQRVRAMRPAAFPSVVDLVDLGAALVTVTLLLIVALGMTGLPRLMFALIFVTFVPGWAVLDHLALAEGVSRVALAVALSLCITTGAALASLWLHLWHPRALLDVSGALCLLAVVSHLARPTNRRPSLVGVDAGLGS